jgi:hypothetical protein
MESLMSNLSFEKSEDKPAKLPKIPPAQRAALRQIERMKAQGKLIPHHLLVEAGVVES